MSYRWDPEARACWIPGCAALVRVLGGPGTGKSCLLIDAAAARIAAGTDPESVLLLTGSGRIGARARSALTTALLRSQPTGPPAVIREPLVRTVHSYAFAVLRLAAQRAGGPPPRLVTAPNRTPSSPNCSPGTIDDGPAATTAWPAELRAALGTAGFAAELRDLLARCAERGVDPQRLQRLGRLSRSSGMGGRRPVRAQVRAGDAAARGGRERLLRRRRRRRSGPPNSSGRRWRRSRVDPELLAAERARIGVLLVDDAQQLDPQAALPGAGAGRRRGR